MISLGSVLTPVFHGHENVGVVAGSNGCRSIDIGSCQVVLQKVKEDDVIECDNTLAFKFYIEIRYDIRHFGKIFEVDFDGHEILGTRFEVGSGFHHVAVGSLYHDRHFVGRSGVEDVEDEHGVDDARDIDLTWSDACPVSWCVSIYT